MLGGLVGQYRIVGLLGQGGMGAVYAAEHTLLARPAAVKVLLPEFSRDQVIVRRFFNEARAATAVRHPGIVEIYDFGWQPDGLAYIVMEHLQGESLTVRRARGRMTWRAALGVIRQIAGALGAAHAKGIVHRDLKPDNVFLVPDPEVPGGERIKLLDFGIAKLVGDDPNQRKTRTGAVLGTPSYMAPEQCRGVAIDQRADLYSLGCILFELCAGRPPFVGEGSGDLIGAHIHVPPPLLASLAPEVPAAVERLVQRLLAKQPGERVQSAEDLVQQIDVALRTVDTGGAPASMTASSVPAVAPVSITTLSGAASETTVHVRSGRRTAVLVAVASIAVGAATVYGVMRWGKRAPAAVASKPAPVGTAKLEAPSPEPAIAAKLEPPPAVAAKLEPPPAVVAAKVESPPPVPEAAAKLERQPPVAAKLEPPPPAVAAKLEPPVVELTIDSVPRGAEVVRAGSVLGKTPYRATLPRSSDDVTLVVRLRGHVDRSIIVRPDKPIAERVKLVPRAKPPVSIDRDRSTNPF